MEPTSEVLIFKVSLAVAWDVQVQREIRIHSQLQHEHIIAFYAAFEDNEHVYLALEYAAGARHDSSISQHLPGSRDCPPNSASKHKSSYQRLLKRRSP